jgi:hypothetical protein
MMSLNRNFSNLSFKSQMAILLTLLTGLVTATFLPYGFPNFLNGLDRGDPFSLALLVSIMGTGFVLLHKIGFGFSYKEEFETTDPAHEQL